MSSVTSGVCRGVFICFICIHSPSSTATFFTASGIPLHYVVPSAHVTVASAKVFCVLCRSSNDQGASAMRLLGWRHNCLVVMLLRVGHRTAYMHTAWLYGT
jgi:hypothetical protein